MTVNISQARMRVAAVAVAAFLAGAITSPLLAGSGLAPITLQPGQQITIVAAGAATPATASMAAATPTPTPTPTATATPTATPTATATPAAMPAATARPVPTAARTATAGSTISTVSTDANVMPTAGLAGWTRIWSDDFSTWNPANYFVYPSGWHDTSGQGAYTPSIISASGGNLNVAIQSVNGVHEVAAFCPLLPGSVSASGHNRGDLLGMRYSFRIRADALPGYKGVPLLWPMSETWPRDGEIDGPESDFTSQPAAFIHHQGGTSSSDQDAFKTPSGTNWQAWHTYVIEWVPGVRADMWVDGVQWLHDTTRIPNTPMHLVMQFETSTSGSVPANTTAGQVQIAWLAAWKLAA